MKPHWMLRLYPGAWRRRYEDEFRALLDDYPMSATDFVDIFMGAAEAQVQFRQLPNDGFQTNGYADMTSQLEYRRARNQVHMMAALYINIALFVVVNLFLLGINLLTSPDTLWFFYPLWGWGMLLTAHAALILRGQGLFAAHALLFVVLNSGLTWINLSNSDTYWFHWPLINLGILLIAYALIAFRITGLFGAHVAATVLVLAEFGIITYLGISETWSTSADGNWVLWPASALLSLLLVHALLRFRRASMLSAHVVLFVVLNVQFILQDVLASGDLWFQYPLVGWGIVLGAHAAIHFGFLPSYDREWQERKQQELARIAGIEGSGEADDLAIAQLEQRAWHLRMLNVHVLAFAVGALAIIALNALTRTTNPWALWPLWGWSIAFSVHAGYTIFRRSLLGAHVMLFLLINAGLFTIDIVYSDTHWFFWPLAGGTLLLLLHVALSQDTRQAIRAWEQRRIASMLE